MATPILTDLPRHVTIHTCCTGSEMHQSFHLYQSMQRYHTLGQLQTGFRDVCGWIPRRFHHISESYNNPLDYTISTTILILKTLQITGKRCTIHCQVQLYQNYSWQILSKQWTWQFLMETWHHLQLHNTKLHCILGNHHHYHIFTACVKRSCFQLQSSETVRLQTEASTQ